MCYMLAVRERGIKDDSNVLGPSNQKNRAAERKENMREVDLEKGHIRVSSIQNDSKVF